MEYFISWQFTQKDPLTFKAQEEIIVSTLAPLVRSETFVSMVTNFYITRIRFTTARLQIFTTHEHQEKIQSLIKESTSHLLLCEKNGPNPNPKIVGGYGPPEREMDFRQYLEDITQIGLDLHLGDLTLAKQFALRARFDSQPRGESQPQEILEDHFRKGSEHYQLLEKNANRLNAFWNNFCFYYNNSTPWDHFYYNMVLGADASNGASREQFARVVGVIIS